MNGEVSQLMREFPIFRAIVRDLTDVAGYLGSSGGFAGFIGSLIRGTLSAGRNTFNFFKGVMQSSAVQALQRQIARIAASQVAKRTASFLFGMAVSAALERVLSSGLRWLRYRQSVNIMSLSWRGSDFVAGISGHKGLIVGEEASKIDKVLGKIWNISFEVGVPEQTSGKEIEALFKPDDIPESEAARVVFDENRPIFVSPQASKLSRQAYYAPLDVEKQSGVDVATINENFPAMIEAYKNLAAKLGHPAFGGGTIERQGPGPGHILRAYDTTDDADGAFKYGRALVLYVPGTTDDMIAWAQAAYQLGLTASEFIWTPISFTSTRCRW